VLSNTADPSGICYPGHELLARRCCCSTRTIVRQMQGLETAALVKRHERRRRNGSRTSDWIVLAPHADDRSPMLDANNREYPEAVAALARSCDRESPDTGGSLSDTAVSPPERSGERSVSSPSGEEGTLSNQVIEVFEHWRTVHNLNGNAKLGAKRKRAIMARLREGRSVEFLKRAVDGNAKSEWHRRHDQHELALIVRDDVHVERFERLADGDADKLTPHQQEVEAALARGPEISDAEVAEQLAKIEAA
jgi:hypothetical protein